MTPALWVIFVTLLLDFMGYGMLIPVLPLHLESALGTDRSEQGLVISLHMIALVLALPVWGWVADRVGRRPVLIVCLAGTGVAFVLMAYTDSLLVFSLARLLQGVFGASVGTAQAYVVDVTPSHERTSGLGMVGAATSLGILGGPAAGGMLAALDPALAFLVPALLAFLAAGAASIWLPESRPGTRGGTSWRQLLQRAVPTPLLFFSAVHTARTRLYLYLFFHLFAVFGAAEAMFPAYAQDVHAWGTMEAGLLLSYLAVVSGVTQGLLLRSLSRSLGEVPLVLLGLALIGPALLGMASVNAAGWVAPLGTGLAVGFGMVVPVFTSLFSRACGGEEERAEYMAHSQAMLSLGRAVGAIVGGAAATAAGARAPFWLAGLGAIAALAVFAAAVPFLVGPRRTEVSSAKDPTQGA